MSYPVKTTMTWSQRTFEADVIAHGPAPTVRGVTLRTWPEGGVDSIEVVVHFEPSTLTTNRPGWPFRMDVTCTSRDADGLQLIVTDGDNRLEDFTKFDADYNISGGSRAKRWANIDALTVEVTITPA